MSGELLELLGFVGLLASKRIGPPRLRRSRALDWDGALAAYEAVRPEYCRRVVTTVHEWGTLWHLEREERLQRNAVLTAREIDCIYGPTALFPQDEPEPYPQTSLASAAAEVSVPA